MLIRREGGKWMEPEVSAYRDERKLQNLIEGNPDLLPGTTRPLAVAREVTVAAGRIDILGVDPTGQITICECKLDANTDARRKVVGQLLSYAGAVWQLDTTELEAAFSRTAPRPLIEMVRELADDDWDETDFWSGLASCLRSGSFRLIVAVDAITDELKKTLRFMNTHAVRGVEILALEISYTRDQDIEIIVPRAYGEELSEPARRSKQWDEGGLLEALAQGLGAEAFRGASELWNVLKQRASKIRYGSGHNPGVSIYFDVDGLHQPVFAIFAYADDQLWSSLNVNFEYMDDRGASRERLSGLAERIRALPGSHGDRLADLETRSFRRRPGLKLDEVVATEAGVAQLVEIVDWLAAPLDLD